MLDEQEINRLAETFKVLGDPTRIKILSALATEELCVCDLAAALEMSVSAISHQLRVLKGARLVKYRREGKNIFYSLDDDHVISLFRLALEHVRHN
jgi:ArsR family transcriptional regulator